MTEGNSCQRHEELKVTIIREVKGWRSQLSGTYGTEVHSYQRYEGLKVTVIRDIIWYIAFYNKYDYLLNIVLLYYDLIVYVILK